jgi:hypothetical protein
MKFRVGFFQVRDREAQAALRSGQGGVTQELLHLGKPKGASTNLHKFMNAPATDSPQFQLGIT